MLSIVSRIFGGRLGKRASVNDAHFWTNFFSQYGGASKSGQNITADNALQNAAVFACVRVLAETIASLPLVVYRRTKNGGKEPATDHVLYGLLHDAPNSWQTSYEWREMIMGHLCLRGNGYAYKETDGEGRLTNIYPLNPARMQVFQKDGTIRYGYTWDDGRRIIYSNDYIWHLRGLSSDGIIGLSPITLAREAIGLAAATEEHGSRFFSNSSKPSGILTHPGTLTEDQRNKLRDSWQEAQTAENRHKVAVLEGGLTWTTLGVSNEDAQFLETRRFQTEEIARIFRVPAVLIGYADKTATYASAEQFFLAFVVHTIRPWTVRIEQSANYALFTEKERRKFFVEFKLDGLMRGDAKARAEFYTSAITNGWMSRNEVRNLENLNPVDGLDEHLQPLNMAPVGSASAGAGGGNNEKQ